MLNSLTIINHKVKFLFHAFFAKGVTKSPHRLARCALSNLVRWPGVVSDIGGILGCQIHGLSNDHLPGLAVGAASKPREEPMLTTNIPHLRYGSSRRLEEWIAATLAEDMEAERYRHRQ